MNRTLRVTAPSVIALALALTASIAEAKPSAKGAEGKRFRLHFDTDVIGFTHVNRDGDAANDDADKDNCLGFGIGRLTPLDGGACNAPGSATNSIGIGFAYAFRETKAGRPIFGGRFSLVVDGANLGENVGKSTWFRGQFQPYFQWMFLPGRWIRPYAEVRLGLGGGVVGSKETDGAGNETKNVQNVMHVFGGFGGGAHFFPVDYFSVDLGLNFNMGGQFNKSKDKVNDMTTTRDWDYTAFIFNLGVMTGVSVWF